VNNYTITIFNAFALIAIGLYGYINSISSTALIAPAIGVILFIFAFPVRKENAVITHITVALTALTALVFLIVGFITGNALILIMAILSLIATVFYITDFLKRKKERETKNLERTSEV
jgi:hypothetical protein